MAKAQGIIKQLKSMLEEMFFGSYVFEVAIILRNSLFVNSILTNMEASYGLTDSKLEKLEKCDEQLLRAVLECPMTTPREMLGKSRIWGLTNQIHHHVYIINKIQNL